MLRFADKLQFVFLTLVTVLVCGMGAASGSAGRPSREVSLAEHQLAYIQVRLESVADDYVQLRVYNGTEVFTVTRLDLEVRCVGDFQARYWVPVMIPPLSAARPSFLLKASCPLPHVYLYGALAYPEVSP